MTPRLTAFRQESPPRRSRKLVRGAFPPARGLFDERGHRLRPRHVDRVAARDLDDRRACAPGHEALRLRRDQDRESIRLNSSHANFSYAVFFLYKKQILSFYHYTRLMRI